MPAAPSLLIVPYRSKTGKLYSQIPTSGAGDFTVTRNTEARRFNSAGLIESVASGIPRLDYYTSGGTAGCPALLVEPSGTNVLSYSEEFDNAAWGKSAMTVSTGTTAAFTAPDETTNADKIIATSGNTAHSVSRTGLTSAAYTFSVFAKAGEESVISLWLRNASVGAEFNLVSGTVSNITVTSARIENYGNGWYRCTVYDATAGTTAHVYGRTGGAYAGNGVDGFYLWGAQLETGSVATSYIPTTTASVTRNADVISVSGAVSGSIGQTEGTVYVEFEHTSNTAERRLIALSDGTSANRVFIWALDNILYAQIQGDNITIINPIPSGYNKVAFAYQQNGVSGNLFASINGGAVVSGTSTTYPSALSRVVLGSRENAAVPDLQWNNRIRAAALYTTRLTNSELATLTTP